MSDWYKDKIIATDIMCEALELDLPEKVFVFHDGTVTKTEEDAITWKNSSKEDYVTYVKAINGYIREDLKNNKDVKRGLYMLSIPSNFISKINLCEYSHVYKERNEKGSANPEVKQWAEAGAEEICKIHPQITKELLLEILN